MISNTAIAKLACYPKQLYAMKNIAYTFVRFSFLLALTLVSIIVFKENKLRSI
jgi:hypothetical protein